MAALKGKELLEHLEKHQGENRDEVIASAGYVIKRSGKQSLQRTRFFEALAAANGHELGPVHKPSPDGFGKDACYRLKVGPKGLIPVSRAYTEQCGMRPGTYVEVRIEDGAVVLYPEGAAAEAAPSCPPVARLVSVA